MILEKFFAFFEKRVIKLCGKPVEPSLVTKKISPQPADDKNTAIIFNREILTDKSDGVFRRNTIVKVINPENGKIFITRVRGSSSKAPIKKGEIGLTYDAQSYLGISGTKDVELHVVPAKWYDLEYFVLFQTEDIAAKADHLMAGLTLAIFLGIPSLILGVVGLAITLL